MNDSEKRRRQLLEQTRERYSDRQRLPAVHPRYGAAYQELYSDGEEREGSTTFGIRAFICFLLFTAFAAMDYQGRTVMNVTSDQIVSEISQDLDVAEVWKDL